MQALNRTTIDYWSLDTEGSEASILSATDFKSIEVGVITVEHNNDRVSKDKIFRVLTAAGMERVVQGGQDDYYASRQYFQRRGLTFPGSVAPSSSPSPPLPSISQELAAVRAHLTSPSLEPYAFKSLWTGFEREPKYNSQIGQDRWVDQVFEKRTGLFVLESGANNG